MKYIIILLFFCLTSFSQNEEKFTIEGKYYNCKTKDDLSFGSFLRLKLNDSIIRDSVKIKDGAFKINDLTKGKYLLEYLNDFDQLTSKEIELNNNITNLKLCTEEFIDTNEKTIFEKMKESDVLELNVTAAGCFHFKKYQIKLFHKKNKLISEYYIDGKRKKRITIDGKKLNAFILFERMLLQRNRRSSFIICTSSMNYFFNLNGINEIEIHDSNCDWDGYYIMTKEIFNIK